jgi:hypothetical protein
MARQEFKGSRHVLVLALTILVFLSGIAVGALMNQEQVSSLQSEIDVLKTGAESADLQTLLMEAVGGERACPVLLGQIDVLGAKLDELAGKLTEYENSRKFGESFKSLKEQYTNLLVRDWLFVRKTQNACNDFSVKTVLYFYTNKDCPDCTNQGVVLDVEKRKMGQDLLIFPVDTDLGVPIVNALIGTYNITSYPSVVIGDGATGGFVPKDALEEALQDA